MSFSTVLFTDRGRALQAKAMTGTALNFTKLQMGSGSLGGQSQITLRNLIDPKVTISISEITRDINYATIKGNFSNADISTGFYWRELGVFAQDPDLGEILYCYGNAGALAEYIPPQSSEIIEKTVSLSVIVGNASQVTATINTSLVFAKIEDLKDLGNNLSVYQAAGGTANEITLANVEWIDGKSISFIVKSNNSGLPTTINGKPLYKPKTTVAPALIEGKAVTVWYNAAGDRFFIKASAEGNANAGHVLAPYTFSNDLDTGIVGTMKDNGNQSATLTTEATSKTIPAGYTSGGTVNIVIEEKEADANQHAQSIVPSTGKVLSKVTVKPVNFDSAKVLSDTVIAEKQGTMTDNGPAAAETIELKTEGAEYSIAKGYHSGLRKIKAKISGLVASVIKHGTTVGGITGTFTSDGDITAGDVLSEKKGYSKGNLIVGNIQKLPNPIFDYNQNDAKNWYVTSKNPVIGSPPISGSTSNVISLEIMPSDLTKYLGDVKYIAAPRPKALVFTDNANAISNDILVNKTAYVNGVGITGTMPDKSKEPNLDAQVLNANSEWLFINPSKGYYPGNATQIGGYRGGIILNEPNFKAENIKQGVNIFGLIGTLPEIKMAMGNKIYEASHLKTYSIYGVGNKQYYYLDVKTLDFGNDKPNLIYAYQGNSQPSGVVYDGRLIYFAGSSDFIQGLPVCTSTGFELPVNQTWKSDSRYREYTWIALYIPGWN